MLSIAISKKSSYAIKFQNHENTAGSCTGIGNGKTDDYR
jgi:hypothetical protein